MAIQSRWALNSLDRHASLAMTRENLQRRNVQVGSLALQAAVLGPERLLRLDVLGVDRDARHRADLHALGFVKVSDTLGAFGRVDFVNFRAQINRLIGALGLTHIAVDAFVGDHQGHKKSVSGLNKTQLSPLACYHPWVRRLGHTVGMCLHTELLTRFKQTLLAIHRLLR